MYRHFGREYYLKQWGMPEGDVPETLILLGTLDVTVHAERWRGYFDTTYNSRYSFLFVGERAGRRCCFAAAFGGPGAASLVHGMAVCGVKRVMLVGSCGGLNPDLQVGEFVLPDRVLHEDGTPRLYSAAQETAATPALVERLRQGLVEQGARTRGGCGLSTDSFMAETEADIRRWWQMGCEVVDMEASTVYAVADHFGMERAAVLYVLDPIGAGRDIASLTEAERLAIRESRRQQAEAVLAVALSD